MAGDPGYGEDHEARLVVRAEPLGQAEKLCRLPLEKALLPATIPVGSQRSTTSDAPGRVRCHH